MMIGSLHQKSSGRARGQIDAKTRWVLFLLITLALVAGVIPLFRARAANPTSGTITPTSAPLVWDGNATGGSSPNGEGTGCTEGVNCDTFTLTVSGTPADWAGKAIEVKFTWLVPANDYDMFIHKTNNAGPVVHSSTGGAPETSESATISPAADGTGVYTVHAVYFSVAPGDQYHATATVISVTPPPPPPPLSTHWAINYHGTCCEGNLAAQGPSTYVLLPVLLTGNKIERSDDGGKTWTRKYPPLNVSQPFGIEGDLNAWGDDVVFFGTEVTDGVCAHSDDRGESWTVVQIPVAFPANDQAWAYLGPFSGMRPGGPVPTDEPYVLAGWYRIGSVALFSFDGGLTWPLQTPLVGEDGSGPDHVVCHQMAHNPTSPGDTRIPDPNFANHKSGRHGAWGTDRKFYWTDTASGSLYVCKTDNFGATWTGIKHPIAAGPAANYVVTHTGFDSKGTLYVLHGNKLYVSFNQGESFAFVHTLPRWGNALRSDSGSDQFFVVDRGIIHIGLLEAGAGGKGNVYYLRGTGVDTAQPVWTEELVDVVDNVRLDFMQIVINGKGIPTISYTTPDKQVTTASRDAPLACSPLNLAQPSAGATSSASSTYPFYNFGASSAIDGDRTGNAWGNGGGWNDGTYNSWPDMLDVDLNGSKTISEIRVYTLQNNWTTAGEPDLSTPATGEGILDFEVQYWNGSAFVTIPSCNGTAGGCNITGNDKAMRVFTLDTPITTTKIQVKVNMGRNGYSRIVEVEAFGCPS